jgi:hypothetical protein
MNLADFIKQHPICCFCGGQASTIDHQPAKIVFPDKYRPKGLEFPACSTCNRQTSAPETLLAFVSRFAGSRRSGSRRDRDRLTDIVGTIDQSFPGLLHKMNFRPLWTKDRGLLVPGGAAKVNQPAIHHGLCLVAAKLALAIYYEDQKRPAPDGCLISTQWTHCHNESHVKHVKNMVDVLPATATLKQGAWKTDDTFFLKYHFEDGHLYTVAIFHEAVALIARLIANNIQREKEMQEQSENWQFLMTPKAGSGITVVRSFIPNDVERSLDSNFGFPDGH